MSSTSDNRSYAAAHFALMLDGKKEIGLLRSVEGGGVRADVMTYQMGQFYDRWRQLGKPKFEDIKCTVGMAMSEPFYDWISNFFEGKAIRKTGSIIAADFYYNERARREFSEALIKDVTFPKLDGSDKSAAYMNVSIAVEDIKFAPGRENKTLKAVDKGNTTSAKGFDAQKLWTACNFQLKLSDFPEALSRVSKIDSFTIKQNIIEYHGGGRRSPAKLPSQIDFPNITFYLPESDAQPFFDRVTARIGQEKAEQRQPTTMQGEIITFDNELKPLFSVHLEGCDVFSVTPDKSDASSEEIKQVKVELYVESMTFKHVK